MATWTETAESRFNPDDPAQGLLGESAVLGNPWMEEWLQTRGAENLLKRNFPDAVPEQPEILKGATGLFDSLGRDRKRKSDYCALNPGAPECFDENMDTPTPEAPTTAGLIDQYNIMTNPLTMGLFSGAGIATGLPLGLLLGIGNHFTANTITHNLTEGKHAGYGGGLTDKFGNPITNIDQIPDKEGPLNFGKDFEKALALSLDPFMADRPGTKASKDVQAVQDYVNSLPSYMDTQTIQDLEDVTSVDEPGSGYGSSPSDDPSDDEYGGGGGEDMF